MNEMAAGADAAVIRVNGIGGRNKENIGVPVKAASKFKVEYRVPVFKTGLFCRPVSLDKLIKITEPVIIGCSGTANLLLRYFLID
jgi:hypothetical protein